MERSSFFHSINGDRKYKASDFAEYFNALLTNGVFPNPVTNLQGISNNNMTITIKAGKAWIHGYCYINDSDLILPIMVADGVLNRIDRVVLKMDTVGRNITAQVKKGTFASSPVAPALQRDADAYELGIADIYIGKGVTSIAQANITDLRMNISLCGWVNSLIQADTTAIFNQYMDWFNTKTGQYNTEMANKEIDFTNQFTAWFDGVKNTLGADIAGNLLNQINGLAGAGRTTETVKKNADDIAALGSSLAEIVTDDTRLTTKKDITGAINELFTNANSGKQNWVDVIGSPLVNTDTFATLKSRTQTLKNTMATNLTAKGQSSSGTDSLNNLINKIPSIQVGLAEEGAQYTKVFVQDAQPTPTKVGDIWVKTTEVISTIYFRPSDTVPHSNGYGWVSTGDIDMSFNVLKALQFVGISGSEITVNYESRTLAAKTASKVKLWNNGYMSIMANLGSMRYWSSTKGDWKFAIASYWNGSSWVNFSQADFNIYVGGSYGYMRKISPGGSKIWEFSQSSQFAKAVAVDKDGYSYVGGSTKFIYKLNPSGDAVWSYNAGIDIYSVAVDKDGYVYCGGGGDTVDGNYYMHKIRPSGSKIWRYGYGGTINSVAVDKDGYSYVGGNDGYMRKISPGGSKIWEYGYGHPIYSVAVDKDGYVYCGGSDTVYFHKVSPSGIFISSNGLGMAVVCSIVVDKNGYVYTACQNGYVNKIYHDLGSGPVWQYNYANNVIAVAVDKDGYVYCGGSNYTFHKVNPSGVKVWQYSYNNYMSSIAVDPGLVGVFPLQW